MLTRPPAKIPVSDVIRAVEGPLSIVDCLLSEDSCDMAPNCSTRPLWRKVSEAIEEVLDSTTLADLVNGGDSSGGKLPAFEI